MAERRKQTTKKVKSHKTGVKKSRKKAKTDKYRSEPEGTIDVVPPTKK